jgi:hypothetical protein
LLFSLNLLAKSNPPRPPTVIDITAEKAKCLGFKVVYTDNLNLIEIEYPILIEKKFKPDSVSVDYYKNDELIFSNFTSYKKSSDQPSVYIVFHLGLYESEDAGLSVSYDQGGSIWQENYVYNIKSVKALYQEYKNDIPCQ